MPPDWAPLTSAPAPSPQQRRDQASSPVTRLRAVFRLANPVQNYAWGMRTAIAELLGEQIPSDQPQAELWLGAHPSAPSRVLSNGSEESLVDVIGAAPEEMLGAQVLAEFGPRLPFLLKVLAVEQPLSLQAHPDLDRAAAGFAEEQDRGVALDDPRRNYRDPHHKPELICALTTFDALCGLRPQAQIETLLAELGISALERASSPAALFTAILGAEQPGQLVDAVLAGCRRAGSGSRHSPFTPSYRCALQLAESYPGDPGVVVSLLLNLVHLRPGQAMYVPPGRLHAYLRGVGVEVMATSDNVLRGGLTPKHVDVPELLSVLEWGSAVPELLDGERDAAGWSRYPTPVTDFALARASISGDAIASNLPGPQILLCVDGGLTAAGQPLTRGQSVFVPAGERVDLTGTGTVFRAASGLPER